MPKGWRIKPGRSLRENARLVIPVMIDNFLSHRDRVHGHPRLKHDLHQMRLEGKRLRYAMETFEPAFNAEFSTCLETLKQLLDTMGSIHDCDVNIPRLQAYLREIRLFNRACKSAQGRISTPALFRLIREKTAARNELFSIMTQTLERWEREQFRDALLRSMDIETFGKE